MSKKLTFAEKIKMQKESSEESSEGSEKLVEEKEEEPKKERKTRKKKEEVLEGGSVEEQPKKKEKRPPSAYNLFVKDAYKSKEVQKLAPKERFAKVAQMWHKHKGQKTKKK